MQIINDSGFDDPTAWSISAALLPTAITGSTLDVNVGPFSTGTVHQAAPATIQLGATYSYRLEVDAGVTPTGAIGAWFGNTVIWQPSDGTGVFTGTVEVVDIAPAIPPNGYGFIFVVTGGARAVFNRVTVTYMHVRQLIREAAATTVTGLTTTGANVFQSRVYNVQESELPCLLVTTGDESVELAGGTLDAPLRILTLTIEGKVRATADIDDTMDDIAEEVETALGADITVGGYAHGLDLASTSIELSGESEQPVGSIFLNYEVSYRTPFGDPTTVA